MSRKIEKNYTWMILCPSITIIKENIFFLFSLLLHWKIAGTLGENYNI